MTLIAEEYGMRTLLGLAAVALAIGSTGAAYAQTSPSTTPLTKPEARYDAMAAGYSYISHLKKDSSGDWTGAGSKGDFIVTPTGKVIPQ
jgi:hypothetical protein